MGYTQDQIKEVDFFDKFTESQEYDVLTEEGYRAIFQAFQQLAGDRLREGIKIVDFGCGTGSVIRRLSQIIKADMVGVDISSNSIRIAQNKRDGIHYVVGDITRLGWAPKSVDVVICSGVLHHFQNFQPCLKEAYRILKDGGCLLSFDPHAHNPAMWFYRHPASPFYSKVGKTDNEQLLSRKQLLSEFQRTGFINANAKAISGVTFKYVESKVARILLPFYNAVEWLMKVPFGEQYWGSFLIGYAEK